MDLAEPCRMHPPRRPVPAEDEIMTQGSPAGAGARLAGFGTRIGLAVGLVAFAVAAGAPSPAGAADQAAVCADKKGKATGTYALGVLKAFGKNQKVPNTGKLTGDISKAQARITKRFAQAELSGYFGPLGCATTGDVGTIESKADDFILDLLDDIPPPP
jgi:hypothetical protein